MGGSVSPLPGEESKTFCAQSLNSKWHVSGDKLANSGRFSRNNTWAKVPLIHVGYITTL